MQRTYSFIYFLFLLVLAGCGKKAIDEFSTKSSLKADDKQAPTLELLNFKRSALDAIWSDFKSHVTYRLQACSNAKETVTVTAGEQNFKFSLDTSCEEFDISEEVDFSKTLPFQTTLRIESKNGSDEYFIVDNLDLNPELMKKSQASSMKPFDFKIGVDGASLDVIKKKIDGNSHLLLRYQLEIALNKTKTESDCTDVFALTGGQFKINLVWFDKAKNIVLQRNVKEGLLGQNGVLTIRDELNDENFSAQKILSLFIQVTPVNAPAGLKSFWLETKYAESNDKKYALELTPVESIDRYLNMVSYENLAPKIVENKIQLNRFSYIFHKANEEEYKVDKNLNLQMSRSYELAFSGNDNTLGEKKNFFLKYYLLTKRDGSFDVQNVDLDSYALLSSGISRGKFEQGSGRALLNITFDFNDLTDLARKNLILIEIKFDGIAEKQLYLTPFQMFGVDTSTLLTAVDQNQVKRLELEATKQSIAVAAQGDLFKKALEIEIKEQKKNLKSFTVASPDSALLSLQTDLKGKFAKEVKEFFCEKFYQKTNSKKSFFDVGESHDAYSLCLEQFETLANIKKLQVIDSILSLPQKLQSYNGNLSQAKSESISVTYSNAKSESKATSVNFGIGMDAKAKIFDWIGIGTSVSSSYSMSWATSETQTKSESNSFSVTEGINFVYNQLSFGFDANTKECVIVGIPDQKIVKSVAVPSLSGAGSSFSKIETDMKTTNTVLVCSKLNKKRVLESWYFIKQRNFDNTYLYDDNSDEQGVLMQVLRGDKHFLYFKRTLAQSKGIILYRNDDKNNQLERIQKYFTPDESKTLMKGLEVNSFPGIIEKI